MNRLPHRFAGVARSAAALLLIAGATHAAEPIESPSMTQPAKAQSVAERKLDTALRLQLQGRASDGTHLAVASDDRVTVKISGTISPDLANAITNAHGTVVEQSPHWGVLRATLPLASVLAIAARADVRRITSPPRARTN